MDPDKIIIELFVNMYIYIIYHKLYSRSYINAFDSLQFC